MPDDHVVGRVGVLVLGTRGADGPGEVRVRVPGGDETFFAWSAEPLSLGAAVLIVHDRGDAHVEVVAWIDPPTA